MRSVVGGISGGIDYGLRIVIKKLKVLNPQSPNNSRYQGLAYRTASGTANSVTPRPGIDDIPGGGLSAYSSLDNHGVSPGKYVVIDTNKLTSLIALLDDLPVGHITIRPLGDAELQLWAATRNTGQVHSYTEEILNSIVDIAKKVSGGG